MFEFELCPLPRVLPFGTPPNLSLHWFGLSLGTYCIDLGEARLLEYTAAFGAPGPVEYQVARFQDDLLSMLADVLQPVPPDLLADVPDFSVASLQAALRTAWEEDEEESPALEQALSVLGARQLDTYYLSPGADIWMWRAGDEVVIEWDNRRAVVDGADVWTTRLGRHRMPATAFVDAVRSFHDRFMDAMRERIEAARQDWPFPGVEIDFEETIRHQRERETWFERQLRRPADSTGWDALRTVLKEGLLRGDEPRSTR